MTYFTLLDLEKEPFSNSPDPELFYNSFQHRNCLQKLEMSIHLKRGLSVVIGEIGTGKSTLCRQLLRKLSRAQDDIVAHLILDPEFTSSREFLQTISQTLGLTDCDLSSEWQMKEAIKNYLFEQGVDQNKIPALIIDEGQKLPEFCIEILREFLNYETNQYKLLQIVIFAQEEFNSILKEKANFTDRIATLHHLKPLTKGETSEMIQFRINKAQADPTRKINLFSKPALLLIHLITGGSPRKIVMLCHKIILKMLVRDKKIADLPLVISSAKETSMMISWRPFKITVSYLAMAVTLIVLFVTILPFNNQVPAIPPTPKKGDIQAFTAIKPKNTRQVKQPNMSYTYPDILGQLPIEQGSSLSKMIARVYGKFNNQRLYLVLTVNPAISEPGSLAAGTKIIFPNLNKIKSGQSNYYIELYASDSFVTTYEEIKKYKKENPSLIIVTRPTKDNKTAYAIVLEQNFQTFAQAQITMEDLPEEYRLAQIVEN